MGLELANPSQSRQTEIPGLSDLSNAVSNFSSLQRDSQLSYLNSNVQGIDLNAENFSGMLDRFRGANRNGSTLAALNSNARNGNDLAGELLATAVKSGIRHAIETAPERRAAEQEEARKKAEEEKEKARLAQAEADKLRRAEEIEKFAKPGKKGRGVRFA